MGRWGGIVPDGCVILKSKFRSLTLRRYPDPLPNLPRTTQAQLVFWDLQIRASSCLIKHGLSIYEKEKPTQNGWKKKKRTEKLGVNLNSTQGSLALNYVNGKWLPHSDLWFFSVSLHWSHSNVSCCHLMTISASVLRLYQVPNQQGRGMLPSWGHGQVLRSILLLRFWDLTLSASGRGPHLDHMDQEAGVGRILS